MRHLRNHGNERELIGRRRSSDFKLGFREALIMGGVGRDLNLLRVVEVPEIPNHVRPTTDLVNMGMRVESVNELAKGKDIDRRFPTGAKMVMNRLITFGGVFSPRKAGAVLITEPRKSGVERFLADRLALDGATLNALRTRRRLDGTGLHLANLQLDANGEGDKGKRTTEITGGSDIRTATSLEQKKGRRARNKASLTTEQHLETRTHRGTRQTILSP
jgi:hypothetical protein